VGSGSGAGVSQAVTLGAEISEDRKHASVVIASRPESGRIRIDLSFYDHPRGVVARLSGLFGELDPVDVVLDPKSQAATLVKPLAEAGIVVRRVTAEEVAVAHGEFMDLLGDGELEHLNQKPLTDAARASVERPLAGAQAWERRVAVDQSPLVAATLACWGFRRWEELSRPGAWAI
jgi:hypothetical protein